MCLKYKARREKTIVIEYEKRVLVKKGEVFMKKSGMRLRAFLVVLICLFSGVGITLGGLPGVINSAVPEISVGGGSGGSELADSAKITSAGSGLNPTLSLQEQIDDGLEKRPEYGFVAQHKDGFYRTTSGLTNLTNLEQLNGAPSSNFGLTGDIEIDVATDGAYTLKSNHVDAGTDSFGGRLYGHGYTIRFYSSAGAVRWFNPYAAANGLIFGRLVNAQIFDLNIIIDVDLRMERDVTGTVMFGVLAGELNGGTLIDNVHVTTNKAIVINRANGLSKSGALMGGLAGRMSGGGSFYIQNSSVTNNGVLYAKASQTDSVNGGDLDTEPGRCYVGGFIGEIGVDGSAGVNIRNGKLSGDGAIAAYSGAKSGRWVAAGGIIGFGGAQGAIQTLTINGFIYDYSGHILARRSAQGYVLANFILGGSPMLPARGKIHITATDVYTPQAVQHTILAEIGVVETNTDAGGAFPTVPSVFYGDSSDVANIMVLRNTLSAGGTSCDKIDSVSGISFSNARTASVTRGEAVVDQKAFGSAGSGSTFSLNGGAWPVYTADSYLRKGETDVSSAYGLIDYFPTYSSVGTSENRGYIIGGGYGGTHVVIASVRTAKSTGKYLSMFEFQVSGGTAVYVPGYGNTNYATDSGFFRDLPTQFNRNNRSYYDTQIAFCVGFNNGTYNINVARAHVMQEHEFTVEAANAGMIYDGNTSVIFRAAFRDVASGNLLGNDFSTTIIGREGVLNGIKTDKSYKYGLYANDNPGNAPSFFEGQKSVITDSSFGAYGADLYVKAVGDSDGRPLENGFWTLTQDGTTYSILGGEKMAYTTAFFVKVSDNEVSTEIRKAEVIPVKNNYTLVYGELLSSITNMFINQGYPELSLTVPGAVSWPQALSDRLRVADSGTYPVTIAIDSAVSDNYGQPEYTFNIKLTVNPRAISITQKSMAEANKTYDGTADPQLSLAYVTSNIGNYLDIDNSQFRFGDTFASSITVANWAYANANVVLGNKLLLSLRVGDGTAAGANYRINGGFNSFAVIASYDYAGQVLPRNITSIDRIAMDYGMSLNVKTLTAVSDFISGEGFLDTGIAGKINWGVTISSTVYPKVADSGNHTVTFEPDTDNYNNFTGNVNLVVNKAKIWYVPVYDAASYAISKVYDGSDSVVGVSYGTLSKYLTLVGVASQAGDTDQAVLSITGFTFTGQNANLAGNNKPASLVLDLLDTANYTYLDGYDGFVSGYVGHIYPYVVSNLGANFSDTFAYAAKTNSGLDGQLSAALIGAISGYASREGLSQVLQDELGARLTVSAVGRTSRGHSQLIDAGIYPVLISTNYSAGEPANVVIEAASASAGSVTVQKYALSDIDIAIVNNDMDYDGLARPAEIVITASGYVITTEEREIIATYKAANASGFTSTYPKNAGDYALKISFSASNLSYTGGDSYNGVFKIRKKAVPAINAFIDLTNIYFTSYSVIKEQTLDVLAAALGGNSLMADILASVHLELSAATIGEYKAYDSGSIPDAGIYDLRISLVGPNVALIDGYQAFPRGLTITKYTLSSGELVVTNSGKPYDSISRDAVLAFLRGGMGTPVAFDNVYLSFKYQAAGASGFSTEKPLHAGDYLVRAEIIPNDNFDGATDEYAFSIDKKNLVITASGQILTYDGREKVLLPSFIGADEEISYSLSIKDSAGNAVSGLLNAGRYILTYTVDPAMTDYTSMPRVVEVVIEKALVNLEVERESGRITVKNPMNGAEYSIDNGKTWQAGAVFEGVGDYKEYTVRVRLASAEAVENYKLSVSAVSTEPVKNVFALIAIIAGLTLLAGAAVFAVYKAFANRKEWNKYYRRSK